MSIQAPSNTLLTYFGRTVTEPLAPDAQNGCKSNLKGRVFTTASAMLSAVGNYSFYGVANSFGQTYNPYLGPLLGAAEATSYFLFRILNFQDIGNHFTSRLSSTKEGIVSKEGATGKDLLKNLAITVLGLTTQYPLMLLVYNANGKSLWSPIATGACEAAFTILSLLKMSASSTNTGSEHIEQFRNQITQNITQFLDSLPSRFANEADRQQITDILQQPLANQPLALLHLIRQSQQGADAPSSSALTNAAKAIGLLMAGYLTYVNGAVTYDGMDNWLGIAPLSFLGAAVVSGANLYLLAAYCMIAAKDLTTGLRDLATGKYTPPLEGVLSPKIWRMGRIAATALAALSFGTTALSAKNYTPSEEASTILTWAAPLSAILLLNSSLQKVSDRLVPRLDPTCLQHPHANTFIHLKNSLEEFRKTIQEATPEALSHFAEELGIAVQVDVAGENLPNNPRQPLLPQQTV